MNAINFLINEHNKVRKILTDLSHSAHHAAAKNEIFDNLCHELLRHEAMEHKVWYPHFRNNIKLDKTVKHLLTEEKHAEKAIAEFNKIRTQNEWEKKFTEFKKAIEKHANEEEDKLFPNVEKILDEELLERIGEEMQEFKKKYNN